MLRTHRCFERFIVCRPRPLENLSLVTIKAESIEILGMRRTFFDVVLSHDDGFFPIPFIEYQSGAADPLIYPFALTSLGEGVLRAAGEAAQKWFVSKGEPLEATLDFFNQDPDLVALLGDPGAAGPAIFPGLVAYGTANVAFSRYQHAATRAKGRRVLDLRAGMGFGAAVLGSLAEVVDAVSDSPLQRAVAQRFGVSIDERPKGADYDLVTAFALAPEQLAEWMPRLQPFIDRGSRVVISVLGDHLNRFSAGPGVCEILRAPANDREIPPDETLIWFEPPSSHVISKPEIPVREAATVAARKLRILFVLRANSIEFPGGDSIQVHRTAEALRARGHDAVVTLDEEPSADGFDIVHLSNMTVPHDTLRAASAVEQSAAAVVLMPIFIDHSDEGVWGYSAIMWAFAAARDQVEVEANLARVSARAIGFDTLLPPPARPEMEPGYLEAQKALLGKSDYLLANAYSEIHRIYRYVDSSIPAGVIPSCTDSAMYGKHNRARFVERYGLDDFILMTGRFEPRKNQLSVIHRFRDSGRQLVFIGRNQFAPYGALVRMFWPENMTAMRFMPEEELAGAYAAARVLAIPSWDEVVSLSSLNGAVSETSMVLSRNGYEHEYFGSDAHYCDPGSADDIARAIDEAWNDHDERKEDLAALSERVRREYTWERAAELTERAYLRILSDNPRGDRRRARFA